LKSKYLKKDIKSFIEKGGIPSQFITDRRATGPISVMSNLLKQMNAKLRQDLYRLSLPVFKNTMIIGIDIIPGGRSKLIGMSATSNAHLSQCFTKLVKQKNPKVNDDDRTKYTGMSYHDMLESKVTEERSHIISELVKSAVANYQTNTRTLPEQIVIYRDGMGGPSLTAKVL